MTLVGDSWSNRFLAGMLGCGFLRYPGCTTREIAELMPTHVPGLCVVVAGVNDMVRHTGPEAYAEGIKAIAARCESTLIVELPRIGHIKATSIRSWLRWTVNRWLRDGGRYEVTDQYRAALRRAYSGPVVPFPTLGCGHWSDPAHLNDAGRRVLADAIGDFLWCRRHQLQGFLRDFHGLDSRSLPVAVVALE